MPDGEVSDELDLGPEVEALLPPDVQYRVAACGTKTAIPVGQSLSSRSSRTLPEGPNADWPFNVHQVGELTHSCLDRTCPRMTRSLQPRDRLSDRPSRRR